MFDVLADPTRRRVIELLASGERSAGELATDVAQRFGISQPGSSRHLRVLREAGAVAVRAEGTRRVYMLAPGALDEIDSWVGGLHRYWAGAMISLEAEVAQQARERNDDQGDAA